MKTHSPCARLAFASSVGVALATSFVARPSFADEKTECMAAASKGQTLRDAHDLIGAEEQFRVCARNVCPPLVQTDCSAWLEAVERTAPSVVLSAKDGDGHDLLDVSVTADGKPLAPKLDGEAVPMNPGLHTFRFALANGTSATSQVLVREGEQAQGIAVVLQEERPAVKVEEPKSPPPVPVATSPVESARGATQRGLGLVLGGVGVVAIAVGSGIALDAKSKDNTAQAEGGTARQTDSLAAVGQGNVGTVVFVAGAVTAAAGVVLWFTAPRAKVAVGTNGNEVLLRGTF